MELSNCPLHQFVLAEGSRMEYGYGMARFGIDDRERPSPVVFGPESTEVETTA